MDRSYISPVFSLPQIIAFISEWNENRRIPLTADVLKRITKLWLSGRWYADIADEVGTNVDDLLPIFSSVLGSHLQIHASRTIRVASLLLEQANIEITPVLLNWPLYLTYGLQHKRELDLTEVGLTDRDAVIALGEWLNSSGFVHDSTDGLRRELVRLRGDILQDLQEQMTVISFEKLQRQMELLNHRNII